MNLRNLVAGLVLCAMTAVYASLIGTIPDRTLPNTPGPTFMPWLVATGLGILSLLLVAQAIAGLVRDGGPVGEFIKIDPKGVGLLVAILALLVAIPYFGFLASGIAFFAIAMVLYGARQPVIIIVAAIAVPLLLQTLFRYAFSIVLPSGMF